jgi:acyl carrier protein
MDKQEQIILAIYEAIDEINRSLDSRQSLERAPGAVLIGDGKLDSLQFLNLTVAVEERIERSFRKAVSVTEAALLGDESDPLTVAALADRIASLVGDAARPSAGAAS